MDDKADIPVANTVSFTHEIVRPSAVSFSFCCSFTGAGVKNQLVIKSDQLEIYTVNPKYTDNSAFNSGINTGNSDSCVAEILDSQQQDPASTYDTDLVTLIYSTRLYGVVASYECFRLPDSTTDCVALGFSNTKLSVLCWDQSAYSIGTIFLFDNEDVPNYASGATVVPPRVCYSQEHNVLSLIVYDHRIYIFAMNPAYNSKLLTPFQSTLDSQKESTDLEKEIVVSPFGAVSPIVENSITFAFVLNNVADIGELAGITRIRSVSALHGFMVPTLLLLADKQHTWQGRYSASRNTCALVLLSLAYNSATALYVPNIVEQMHHQPHESVTVVPLPSPLQGSFVISAHAVYHYNNHFIDLCFNTSEHGNYSKLFRGQDMTPLINSNGDEHGLNLANSAISLLRSFSLSNTPQENSYGYDDQFSLHYVGPADINSYHILLEYVISLESGATMLMQVVAQGSSVHKMRMVPLSEGVQASSLTSLSNSLLYVGSKVADGCILQFSRKLTQEAKGGREEESFLDELSTPLADIPTSKVETPSIPDSNAESLETSTNTEDFLSDQLSRSVATTNTTTNTNSSVYTTVVRLVFPALAPISNMLTHETKEGISLVVTSGQGKAGALTTVSEYLRPFQLFSPSLDKVEDPVVGIWAVYLDDNQSNIQDNKTLTFHIGNNEYQGPKRPLLALLNVKKEVKKITRKNETSLSSTAISQLIDNDPRSSLALHAFQASLEHSDVIMNGKNNSNTHKTALIVATTTTRTYTWTMHDVSVADQDAHLATLRNKDDGQIRAKSVDQLRKLYKLTELGKLHSTTNTSIITHIPSLLVTNVLFPFTGVLQVTARGFILTDAAAVVLTQFDMHSYESGLGLKPTDAMDTCIVQAVYQEPYLTLLTSDNSVFTVQFLSTPLQSNWYHIAKFTVPVQDLLPSTPICSVGLSTLPLQSFLPNYLSFLQEKPSSATSVSTKRDLGHVDLLQDIFSEDVVLTNPQNIINLTSEDHDCTKIPLTLLFLCRTDRMDIILPGVNRLIMSCPNPAQSSNVLTNVLDDHLKRDSTSYLQDNILHSTTCLKPIVTVEPRAAYVMNIHISKLHPNANTMVYAQTDNGDIYVYHLFEYITANMKTMISKQCSNTNVSILTNLLANVKQTEYMDIHTRMQAYASALIPLLPVRMRLLPLQQPVRVSLIQKQTLDSAINSVRSRLVFLWNKYVNSIQTVQQKRKKKKMSQRYELLNTEEMELVEMDTLPFTSEEEHECKVKLAYLAQLTGTNNLNLSSLSGVTSDGITAMPSWAKYTSTPTDNLYSLTLFRVRSAAAVSPSLQPILNPFSTCCDAGLKGVLLCMNNTLLTIKSRFGMPEPVLLSTCEDERSNVNKPLFATSVILPISKIPLLLHADINVGLHVSTFPLSLPTAFAFKQAPFNHMTLQANLSPFNRICHAVGISRNRRNELVKRSQKEVASKLPRNFHHSINTTSNTNSHTSTANNSNNNSNTIKMENMTMKDELDDLFQDSSNTSNNNTNNTTNTNNNSVKDELDNLFIDSLDADISKQVTSSATSTSESIAISIDHCISALATNYAYLDGVVSPALLIPPLPETPVDMVTTANGGVWNRVFLETTPTHLSYHKRTDTLIVASSYREEGFSQEDIASLSTPLYALRFKIQLYSQSRKELLLSYEEFEQDEAITAVHTCVLSGKEVVCISVATHNGPDTASKGRIVVLEPYFAEGISHDGYKQSFLKLRVILHKDKLPVLALSSVDGFLAAGCGSKIFLYELNTVKNNLVGRAFYPCQLAVVGIQTCKNIIVVSDAFHSISILIWDPNLREMTLLARHHANLVTSTVSMYVYGDSTSFFVTDNVGNSELIYYHPKRMSSRKYQRLAARAEYFFGSPVTATSFAFAPSPTRIADQLKTQLCALLANYPNSLTVMPNGLDSRHNTLADALRATRTSPNSLKVSIKDNIKSQPNIHHLRTCLYNGTKSGSIVAMLPIDLFPHFPTCSRVFQELACVQPHVAGLDFRQYRSWQKLLGVGTETALTTRTELFKYDVIDIDAIILLALVPMVTQSEIAKEAGATAAAVIETVLNSFLAMRLK